MKSNSISLPTLQKAEPTKMCRRNITFHSELVAPLRNPNSDLYTLGFFSGVDGIGKGASRAGFTSLLQSDIWPWAGKAFELNIPSKQRSKQPEYLKSEGIFLSGEKGDITKMNFASIQEHIRQKLNVKIEKGQIGVVHGGPPCQDFSKSNNHKKVNGARNRLIFDLLRLIDESKAKVGLIEQVPDLLSPKFAHIWCKVRLILNRMTDYTWSYKVLNAQNYGARQNRKRLIIMLVRRDIGKPSFPIGSEPDLSKVAVQSLLKDVYHFSPGQYADTIKSAKDNVFCTMTATGSEYLYGLDGKRRKPTMPERLILTELEGLNLDGIPETHQKKLVGNMVQVSFAEALFRHIIENILRVSNTRTLPVRLFKQAA